MSSRNRVDYDEKVEQAAIAAKEGDLEARNALYLEHSRLVLSLGRQARGMLRATHTDRAVQPADIDQQSFIEFCALLDAWEPGHVPFMAYLAKLLPWRLLHYVRREMHYRARVRMVPFSPISLERAEDSGHNSADADYADTGTCETEIEDEAAGHNITSIESSDLWRYHTDPLEDGLREAVKLRYGLGLSSREIAARQGCSRRTVDRDLRAAISAIKRSIEDEWENCS